MVFRSLSFAKPFFALSLLFLAACSRSTPEKLELKIGVPVSKAVSTQGQQSVGRLSVGEELGFVIINLRESPGATPRIFMFERERDFSSVQAGETLTLSIKGSAIPVSSSTIIQYLGGFEDYSTGAIRFSYGDAVVNTAVNGVIAANIAATTVGAASGKQINFGGRYLSSPNGGPTGGLITYFKSPNTAMPAMAVERREMIDGWFSAFALEPDGTGFPQFTFKLQDTATGIETVLWDNVNSSSAMFTAADPDSYIQKFNMPPHFRRERRSVGFELYADPGGWYAAGYWQSPSAGNLSSSTHGAAVTALDFALEGLSTDEDGLSPLGYSYTTPAGFHRDSSQSDANAGATDLVKFHPERVMQERTDVFGFRGLFRIVKPEDRFEGAFIRSSFDGTNINLEWEYLPVQAGHITGAVVFHKTYTGGSSDGEEGGFSLSKAPNCFESLVNQGYLPYASSVTDTLNPIVTSYTQSPGGVSFSMPWNQSFAICPYKEVAGVRTYYPTYARTSCIGSCSDWLEPISFGRRVPGPAFGHDVTVSSSVAFDQFPFYGESSRISDVSLSGINYTISLVNDISSSFPQGEEALVMVMGKRGATTCGQSAGEGPIEAGEYEFAQVVSSAPYSITVVPKSGRLIKALELATVADLANPSTTTGFCYAQIVRVPHFGNLTFNAGASVSAVPFSWGGTGGGIVAFRVNGTLEFIGADGISAVGAGYPGGAAQQFGSSTSGQGAVSGVAAGAGRFGSSISSGGGARGAFAGGGLSAQGAGTIFNSGGANIPFNPNPWEHLILRMGSGGGGSGGTATGGNGGGIILVAARQIKTGSTATSNVFDASAGSTPGESTLPAGGGGGGGSVNIFTLKIDNSQGNALAVKAHGGTGGVSASAEDGGGGGGGHVRVRTCGYSGAQATVGDIPLMGSSQTSTPAANTIQGGASGGAPATGGMDGIIDLLDPHPMCDF